MHTPSLHASARPRSYKDHQRRMVFSITYLGPILLPHCQVVDNMERSFLKLWKASLRRWNGGHQNHKNSCQ